jgi:Glycosyl transferases group 1
MSKQNVLFITNEKYINPSSMDGGVKFCTGEYINLIQEKYDIIFFPLQLKKSISYRFKKKLKLTAYNDYNVEGYSELLKSVIQQNNIDCVFLNLTNTIYFSKLLKKLFPFVKIILCSHGNESGDFLHETVMYESQNGVKKIISDFTLGKMLSIESTNRKYVDLVLTVSEVELNIEKWLGAEKVYLVYRTITGKTILHQPVNGRIGFFGDLSHPPNFYGIKEVCEALQKMNASNIEIRLAGAHEKKGRSLAADFPFVTFLGYLSEEALQKEVGTWAFGINPVFYYSRGVSTKLGKMLQWGLPVITSIKGMRGYNWQTGEILKCNTAKEMAGLMIQCGNDMAASVFYREEIVKMKASAPTLEQMINEIAAIINP